MEIEEFLKNRLFNKSEVARLLYSEESENRRKASSRLEDKITKRNYNKLSAVEKEKIIEIFENQFKILMEIKNSSCNK
ncbi:hypothetical protein [Apibacter mensalis]|uniref:hypothetical protein n=1 Tax=Apibacter mensalis TaxID=1586267 RepID=UPI0026F05323|nr:hypothetical protein [Apibacter mensalis]